MSYSIVLTRDAEEDLRGVFEYIAFALQSPQNASGQLDRLERGISSLSELPMRSRLYDKEPWTSRGLRVLTVDNYLVFCIPDGDALTVTVIRVLYGGRDAEKLL